MASDLRYTDQPIAERLIVHYDLYVQKSNEFGFNYIYDLSDNSAKVTVVTLYVPRSRLIKHVNSRVLKQLCELIDVRRKSGTSKELLRQVFLDWNKRSLYSRGGSDLLYERWFDYLNRFPVITHWLLNHSKSPTMCIDKAESFRI